jgi:hypothetical protein
LKTSGGENKTSTGKIVLIVFNFLFRLDVVVSGMIIRLLFISFFVATTCLVNGQTVVVNPDGTHSVMIGSQQTGSPGIIVHSNGQHSVVHKTGTHSVVVRPDGGHSVMVGSDQPGSPKIIVHLDGKHSVMHSTGAHSVVIGSDGAHCVMVNHNEPNSRLTLPYIRSRKCKQLYSVNPLGY